MQHIWQGSPESTGSGQPLNPKPARQLLPFLGKGSPLYKLNQLKASVFPMEPNKRCPFFPMDIHWASELPFFVCLFFPPRGMLNRQLRFLLSEEAVFKLRRSAGRESRNRLLQDLNKGTLKTTRPSGLARLAVAFGQETKRKPPFWRQI